MPIYEYICDSCNERFEKIVINKQQEIACPKCASKKATIQLSVFATAGSGGSSAQILWTEGRCLPRAANLLNSPMVRAMPTASTWTLSQAIPAISTRTIRSSACSCWKAALLGREDALDGLEKVEPASAAVEPGPADE